jgi:phosphoenolpyruvate synthase/pyruvate phosphate dikinase
VSIDQQAGEKARLGRAGPAPVIAGTGGELPEKCAEREVLHTHQRRTPLTVRKKLRLEGEINGPGHYIVQARPETVASQRAPGAFETDSLKGTGGVLAAGRAVGEKIAWGKVRIVADAHDLTVFQPSEVLVAEATSPDWESAMKSAAAIVTSHGGRTCHAAIVARELGVPAVVGAAGAVEKLATGRVVTVSRANGEVGKVFDGQLPFEVARVASRTLPRPRTAIMINLGNPELAYHTAMLPNDGSGSRAWSSLSTSTSVFIQWRSFIRKRSRHALEAQICRHDFLNQCPH